MLGLKIDVDTYAGMKDGVPCLLRILNEFGVKATFFLSIGPDNSGRALLQLIRNPRFLKKMLRTNAPGLYGWKTALYGTLLPAPMIALSFPDIVRQIIHDEHEVQFHAWDHRRWQDELFGKTDLWIRDWFERGIAGFETLTGRKPSAFGAPSWLIDDRVLNIAGQYRFEYLSCTRADAPFIHEANQLLELPSDLPCFEELAHPNSNETILGALKDGKIHILPVHAEVEGGIYQDSFREILRRAKNMDLSIGTLNEIKNTIDTGKLKTRRHAMKLLQGRHSPCAV